MKRWGDNSLDKKFKYGCGITQLLGGLSGPIEKNSREKAEMNEVSNEYNYKIHIAQSIEHYIKSQIDRTITTNKETFTDSSSNEPVFDGCNRSQVESSTRQTDIEKIGIEQPNFKHLWLQCENCYQLNYKNLVKSKQYICEQCGDYLQLSSSDRIEFFIDEGTWAPMNENIFSRDPILFDFYFKGEDSYEDWYEDPSEEYYEDPYEDPSEESYEDSSEDPYEEYYEDSYEDDLDFYQMETGLTEAVQTGIGKLNGIAVAIGVMDFKFMGGSMGAVVGEKITRLIEHATKKFLPLIIVSASGGARMQEGSLSLMQMAKISSALYDYQSNKRLFYISILTSPTAGGVTASFGMLGDIIIAEPNAYIAFAGKRVIEQTLKQTIPVEAQEAEFLFENGSFDLILPRHLFKSVMSELFTFHN
uniref:Acetyl-coenzyme A carboxylase carboxyl transferase subunit beta n=1 Tax=Cuscuta pedicellata TaxID=192827 RepID=A0A7H0DH06_9ASTE|nr:acetyl-CoA carboxylase carboxyltransferase beta subunit [Cuscuta pedicellata]QNP08616.1 acetyl-CoA carboxylase carboxyltransferase beta subunit [Cuscuta pedicellata]